MNLKLPDASTARPTCPQVIWEEIARRLVRGQKQSDIAADLRRSPSSVCNTIRHRDFRPILAAARAKRDESVYNCEEHFQTHLRRACSTITDILDDGECPQGIRLGAAREVLRQSGYTAKTQPPGPTQLNVENLTFDQRIQSLAAQSLAETPGGPEDAPSVIDAEVLQEAQALLPTNRATGDLAPKDPGVQETLDV